MGDRVRAFSAPRLLVALFASLAAMTAAAEGTPLDGTVWVLTGLAAHPLREGVTATLQFTDDRVSGSDGCNRYGGTYKASSGSFEVSPSLVSTRMACAPEVDAQARAYLAALTGAKSYRVAGGQLELLSADGRALATLRAQPAQLAGTSWRATAINNGRQAVASVITGSDVTLAFGADGQASGSGGCNHYAGQYESQGSSITFGRIAVTAMACAQPPGVMEQEQLYFKALASASSVRFEGDRMELRTGEGALAVTFLKATGG